MNSKFFQRIRASEMIPLLGRYFSGDDFPDKMTPERLKAYQQEMIRYLIDHAYQKSPFFRGKMDAAGVTPQEVQSVEDLGKVPMTAKEELRGNPWLLLACPKEDVSIIHVSSGTTGGEPIYVMQTWQDYYLNESAAGYPVLFPIEKGDICLNALPYEMSSAGLAFHKTFINSCLATTIPAGKGGAYSKPEKTVKLMMDLQPTIVITSPSYAVQLAEAAQATGFDPASLKLKKMWLTGEGCSSAFRERVEKLWGATANFYYGSLEGGGIGIECDTHAGYHIIQGHTLVEIVDPKTGKVLEPGEIGEIVVTCLLRLDTPLIRYRTQDLGYIDPDPCACGVTLPRLFLRGRLVDHVTVQGIQFSPFYLEEFLMRLPEVGNWYQFVVKKGDNDRLTVRCELAKGIPATPELAERLANKLEFSIGVPVEFQLVERLPRPREKTVRVVHEEEERP